MEEIWKDIKDYEGLYQVSNLGRVKSLNYLRTEKEQILKTNKVCRGYYQVVLWKDKKPKRYSVHRLVAEAFLPNPFNYPIINHKDENPSNNCSQNLEWVTYKYNSAYSVGTSIKCLDLETKEIIYYSSFREAERDLNIYESTIRYSLYKSKKPCKNRYIFSLV